MPDAEPIRLNVPPHNFDQSAGAVRRQMLWDVQVRGKAHVASSFDGYLGHHRFYDHNSRRLLPRNPKGSSFEARQVLSENGRSDPICWAGR